MSTTRTDSCECGRADVGPRHCPVHGDGQRAAAPAERSRPRALNPWKRRKLRGNPSISKRSV